MCLKFYSQNCFGLPVKNKSVRFRNILGGILENRYDVIFLQEIFFKRDLKNFLKYLNDDYYIIYSGGKYIIRGGLVLLVKKNILKNFSFKTNFVKFKNPSNLSLYSYEKLLCQDRGFLYCHIEDLNLYFVNVHCLNVFFLPFFEKAVVKQLKELKAFLKQKRCFVGGDFNLSLRDSFFEKEKNINLTPNVQTYRLLKKQVDYIIASNLEKKEICPKDVRCISAGSDHFGLVSEIKLKDF